MAPPEQERPVSPNKIARAKAAEAAEVAARAAAQAGYLLRKTQDDIAAVAMHNSSLPCSPISPSGVREEAVKHADATTAPVSPWFQAENSKGPRSAATLYSCPTENDDGTFRSLSDAGLGGLSASREPLTVEQARWLATVLLGETTPCPLRALSLSRALDSEVVPPLPPKLLEATMDAIAQEIGPETDEENVAKLTARLEKLKQEFTTFEAGIEFLAKRQLDRLTVLFRALQTNASITDLDLSYNGFGQPNAEGKSQFAPLRRLATVIDENTTITRLDLKGNRMGATGVGIVAKAMCKNIAIHTLDLGGCDITQEGADEEEDPDQEPDDPVFGELMQGLPSLSEMFKKNKFLRCLCLRGNRIKAEIDEAGEDDGLETPFGQFLEPLRKYHRLAVLDLSGNELGAGGARMVADVLLLNRSIEVLDISDNDIGPKGLRHVARLLKGTKAIRILAVQLNGLGGNTKTKKGRKEALEAATEFGAAMAESKSLQSLNISSNHFGPELSAAVLKGLSGAGKLQSLAFGMNDLCGAHAGEYDDVALQVLLAALERSSIQDLGLGGNFLQAQGMQILAGDESLPRPPLSRLVALDLSRNALEDAGAQHLFRFVASPECVLRTLNVSNNGLCDCVPLAKAIRSNATIETLDLSSNVLGNGDVEGFRSLVDALVDRPHVAVLDLSSNHLADSHGSALAYLCRTATHPIESLNLRENPRITLKAAENIIAALKHNGAIRTLKLTPQGADRSHLAKVLTDVLADNKALTDVDLEFPLNDVDDATITSIQTALLRNSLRWH